MTRDTTRTSRLRRRACAPSGQRRAQSGKRSPCDPQQARTIRRGFCSVKLTVTVMTTGVWTLFTSVGVSHCSLPLPPPLERAPIAARARLRHLIDHQSIITTLCTPGQSLWRVDGLTSRIRAPDASADTHDREAARSFHRSATSGTRARWRRERLVGARWMTPIDCPGRARHLRAPCSSHTCRPR